MSGNLAIVGKKQDILPFLGTGAMLCPVEKGEAEKKISELILKGIHIVFFTEDLTEELQEILNKYQTDTFPCLVPFSTGVVKTRIAIERLRRIIKRAIGADVFLEEK